MHNRVHYNQNKSLMLKSYIPGINTSILPNQNYEYIFTEKLVNELHAWVENYPHVIHPPNVKYSFLLKVNCTILKKQKHIPKMTVREINNDMILPISDSVFLVQ